MLSSKPYHHGMNIDRIQVVFGWSCLSTLVWYQFPNYHLAHFLIFEIELDHRIHFCEFLLRIALHHFPHLPSKCEKMESMILKRTRYFHKTNRQKWSKAYHSSIFSCTKEALRHWIYTMLVDKYKVLLSQNETFNWKVLKWFIFQ